MHIIHIYRHTIIIYNTTGGTQVIPCPGVTENASKAYRRDRSSLCDLLQLEELPVISENAHLEKLESLRMTPLPGEEQVVWAIQDVNLPQTRQILPDWLSSPMAVQLLKWKSDKEKWNIKIAKRPNNTLTPHMQKKFDEWEIHNKERPLLFRKSKQALVPYVKDHTELKKIRSDLCIATLELNDDVSKLRVRAGDGAVKQLVALRCQACEGVAIPDCLSKAFPDSAMEGVLPTCLEDADDRGGRIEEEEEEAFLDASEQEAKAMIVEEMNATGDECPSEAEDLDLDPIDILAITDDEEELHKVAPRHTRIKSFMHRASYVKLASKGLVDLPTALPGICLGCHTTTNQWQGFTPGVHSGLSFSWSGNTGRTETEALLLCIKGILTAYVDRFPRETLWKLGHCCQYIFGSLGCLFLGGKAF